MTTPITSGTPSTFGDPIGIGAGLPEPELIARLANELFTTVPGQSQAPASELFNTAGIPGVQSVPVDVVLPGSAAPTEAELRALPASLAIPGFYFLDQKTNHRIVSSR